MIASNWLSDKSEVSRSVSEEVFPFVVTLITGMGKGGLPELRELVDLRQTSNALEKDTS